MDRDAELAILADMRRVTHRCGHDQDHYIIAEYAAEADRQAARLARRKCNACGDAAALVNRSAAGELGLVVLQGSAKQVAWAETIRAKRIAGTLSRDRDSAISMAKIADAKWWIDNRLASHATIIATLEKHRQE